MISTKSIGLFNLLIASMISWSGVANSDVIVGEIKFIKKAPFSGVLYVRQTQASLINANMDQLDKQFTQKVAVGAPDSSIIFKNGDSFDHNIFANDLKNSISFDIGLMLPGHTSELKMDWAKDTMVRIGCKIHPKMRAYIANINSDHFQIFEFQKKKKTYSVDITDVPSFNREITLMIPKYDPITITLNRDETKIIDITKKGKVRGSLTLARK